MTLDNNPIACGLKYCVVNNFGTGYIYRRAILNKNSLIGIVIDHIVNDLCFSV